jgi:sodium-dependent dicarboxylate transporter 2/3/5
MNIQIQKPGIKSLLASLPGLIIYVFLNFYDSESSSHSFYISIGVAALMINLWIAEPFPLWLSSLLPLILLPLHGILDFKNALSAYYNKTIFLFLGGFLLAYSIEKWQLHKRIAFKLLSFTGDNPKGIVWGMMLSTCLISMWISNTATAIMMLPVAISITNIVKQSNHAHYRTFFLCMMLGIAYSANIGGIATIIGTPPNIVYMGYINTMHQTEISFLQWMVFGVPLSLIMLWLCYHVLVNFVYKIKIKKLPEVAEMLDQQANALGKIKRSEKRTLMVFSVAAFLWIFSQPLNNLFKLMGFDFKLQEHVIAMVLGCVLFLFPNGEKKSAPLLEFNDLKFINWGILILFGGGMCMAKGLEVTGVISSIGKSIQSSQEGNYSLLLLSVIGASLFLTELMSNVALSQIFIPVVFAIASALGMVNAHSMGLPVVIACSFAFMFPISTPPNAVVFSSGLIKIKDMAIAGFFINIVGILILWLCGLYLFPLLF